MSSKNYWYCGSNAMYGYDSDANIVRVVSPKCDVDNISNYEICKDYSQQWCKDGLAGISHISYDDIKKYVVEDNGVKYVCGTPRGLDGMYGYDKNYNVVCLSEDDSECKKFNSADDCKSYNFSSKHSFINKCADINSSPAHCTLAPTIIPITEDQINSIPSYGKNNSPIMPPPDVPPPKDLNTVQEYKVLEKKLNLIGKFLKGQVLSKINAIDALQKDTQKDVRKVNETVNTIKKQVDYLSTLIIFTNTVGNQVGTYVNDPDIKEQTMTSALNVSKSTLDPENTYFNSGYGWDDAYEREAPVGSLLMTQPSRVEKFEKLDIAEYVDNVLIRHVKNFFKPQKRERMTIGELGELMGHLGQGVKHATDTVGNLATRKN